MTVCANGVFVQMIGQREYGALLQVLGRSSARC
jgi:hypothetical protein